MHQKNKIKPTRGFKERDISQRVACALWCLAAFLTATPGAPAGPVTRGAPIDSAAITNAPTNSGSASPGSTNAAPANASPPRVVGGYLQVGFDRLSDFPAQVVYEKVANSNKPSFHYESKLITQIPAAIQEMDGKKVAVNGFMLPLQQTDGGRITDFILLKNQSMCCYGAPPAINEWVHVQMGSNSVRCVMDQVVTIYGKLRVGEYKESRQLPGLYRMDGERMEQPEGF